MKSRTCHECGRTVAVGDDGRFRRHRVEKKDRKKKKSAVCAGSGNSALENGEIPVRDGGKAPVAANANTAERCCRCQASGHFGRRTPDGPLCDKCAHTSMLDTVMDVMNASGDLTPEVRQRAELLRRIIGG